MLIHCERSVKGPAQARQMHQVARRAALAGPRFQSAQVEPRAASVRRPKAAEAFMSAARSIVRESTYGGSVHTVAILTPAGGGVRPVATSRYSMDAFAWSRYVRQVPALPRAH